MVISKCLIGCMFQYSMLKTSRFFTEIIRLMRDNAYAQISVCLRQCRRRWVQNDTSDKLFQATCQDKIRNTSLCFVNSHEPAEEMYLLKKKITAMLEDTETRKQVFFCGFFTVNEVKEGRVVADIKRNVLPSNYRG